MGFLDSLKGKKPDAKKEEPVEEQPPGKYSQECALCGNPGTERKWMGQYWHKKCIRVAKKGARKMI